MSFQSPTKIICGLCNRRIRDAHGKVRLVRQRPRWAPWGRAWRARDKRGPARRLPPSGRCGVENRPQIGRNVSSTACRSRTPSGSSALTLLSGSILFIVQALIFQQLVMLLFIFLVRGWIVISLQLYDTVTFMFA